MKYKDLEVWKESISLLKDVYKMTDLLPKTEEYNLISQIKRAIVSVALNIAEGKARSSAKDFAHFLNIAIGSLYEVEACLTICEELQYIKVNDELHEKCEILARRVNALKKQHFKGGETVKNNNPAAKLPSCLASLKILVTGANGMLGQDLCPILEKEGYTVIRTDVGDMDITKADNVEEVLSDENPDIVIHCAAYTNVDKAEDDLKTARLINSLGTENIAKACGKRDITLVYISTDYVFQGNRKEPYTPDEKREPLNNYGLTKMEGELAIEQYCSKYFITRTAWLYGIHGKNFVETMISLADKPEIKVVDDQVGCPTWTVELANGIIKLLKTQNYGRYHICGSGHTSWYGFAKEIFKLANLNVNLLPCSTDEYKRPAKRPVYSVMENNGICRDWKEALSDYIKLREVK